MTPPTKFALMRANRPKLAEFRQKADDLEAQAMAGVDVHILLTPAMPVGNQREGHWWERPKPAPIVPPRQNWRYVR